MTVYQVDKKTLLDKIGVMGWTYENGKPKNWTLIPIWNEDKKRYQNYMAVVKFDYVTGKYVYDWLSKNELGFDVEPVKKGDILMVGCKEKCSGKAKKKYYRVKDITDDKLVLDEPQKNYRNALPSRDKAEFDGTKLELAGW